MTAQNASLALPQLWVEVLDQVQVALAAAEAATSRRLATEPPAAERTTTLAQSVSWQLCLERLRKRLEGLDACLAKAKDETTGAEAACAEGAAALERWLAGSRAVAQMPAEGSGVTVG